MSPTGSTPNLSFDSTDFQVQHQWNSTTNLPTNYGTQGLHANSLPTGNRSDGIRRGFFSAASGYSQLPPKMHPTGMSVGTGMDAAMTGPSFTSAQDALQTRRKQELATLTAIGHYQVPSPRDSQVFPSSPSPQLQYGTNVSLGDSSPYFLLFFIVISTFLLILSLSLSLSHTQKM